MLKQGYTLTGLLVAMAVGTILLSAAIKFVMSLTAGQLAASEQLDLENQLSRLGLLIYTEVRRSGYDANSHHYFTSGQPRDTSPFYPAFVLSAHPGEPENSCILFHYDKNHNGTVDATPISEARGFRLHDGAIESRVAAKSCGASGWQDVNDPEYIVITAFSLTPVSASGNAILLALSLEGKLRHDETRTASLNWPVIVSNY